MNTQHHTGSRFGSVKPHSRSRLKTLGHAAVATACDAQPTIPNACSKSARRHPTHRHGHGDTVTATPLREARQASSEKVDKHREPPSLQENTTHLQGSHHTEPMQLLPLPLLLIPPLLFLLLLLGRRRQSRLLLLLLLPQVRLRPQHGASSSRCHAPG